MTHQPAHRGLQNLLRGLHLRHAEALPEVDTRSRVEVTQGNFLEGQCDQESDHGHRRRAQEHQAERVGVGVDDRRGDVVGQTLQGLRRLCRLGRGGVDCQRGGDAAFQEVGEQRPEDGRTERTSDGAEERHARRRDAEVGEVGGALHDQHQYLHAQPDPGSEHEQVGALLEYRGAGVHLRQQHESHRHDRGADDGEHLVATGAADQHAAAHGGQQQPAHHRQRAQAGLGGRDTVDELHEGRQEGQRTQHRETDDEGEHTAHGEHGAGEQPDGQHGFVGAQLDPDEQRQHHRRADEQTDDHRRRPCVGASAPAGGQRQPGRAEAYGRDAGVVDGRPGPLPQRRDRHGGHGEHDQGDGDVDPERPAPAEVIGEVSAQQGADHRRHAEHRTQRALIPAPIAQRDHLADQRHRRHHDRAATDAL